MPNSTSVDRIVLEYLERAYEVYEKFDEEMRVRGKFVNPNIDLLKIAQMIQSEVLYG